MEYHERDVRQHRDGAGSCLVERMRREVDHTGDRIVLSSRVKFTRDLTLYHVLQERTSKSVRRVSTMMKSFPDSFVLMRSATTSFEIPGGELTGSGRPTDQLGAGAGAVDG